MSPGLQNFLQQFSRVKYASIITRLMLGLVIVFCVVGGGWWWQSRLVTDELIRLAPANTFFYAHVQQPRWPWERDARVDLPFVSGLSALDGVLQLPTTTSQQLIAKSKQTAVALFDDQVVLFFDLPNQNDIATIEQAPYHARFGETIFVIASTAQAIEGVMAVGSGEQPSLAMFVDRRADDPLYFYSNRQQDFQTNEFSELVDSFLAKQISINGKKIKAGWLLRVDREQTGLQKNRTLSIVPTSTALMLGGVEAGEFVRVWQQALIGVDETVDQFAITHDQVEVPAATLSSLVISVLVLNETPPQVMVWFDSPNQNQADAVVALLVKLLSEKFPQSRSERLPDGSFFTELVVDEASVTTTQTLIDGQTVYQLFHEPSGASLWYQRTPEGVTAASDPRVFETFRRGGLELARLQQACGLGSAGPYTYVNPELVAQMQPDFALALPKARAIIVDEEIDRVSVCILK